MSCNRCEDCINGNDIALHELEQTTLGFNEQAVMFAELVSFSLAAFIWKA